MATQNVTMKSDGKTLTVTINLKERLGRSKSLKSTMVATTGGIVQVPNSDVKIGINAFIID